MTKDVLIGSIGLVPQVVTETVWALMNPQHLIDPGHRKRDVFIPSEIHLVATAASRDRLERQDLAGRLATLMRQQGVPPAHLSVTVPTGADGAPIADIRTEAETIAYANHVTRLVERFTARPETRVHVSVAGGRKSMTCYDHSALMLFGREQDSLSHVLVEPAALETCPDFWWPGQPEATVPDRDGRPLPTGVGAARVDLVPTPFIRLNRFVKRGSLSGPAVDYRSVVRAVQDALDLSGVTLRCGARTLRIGSMDIVLPHREFALYATLATAAVDGWPGAGPDGVGDGHYGWVTMDGFRDPDGVAVRTFARFYEQAFLTGSARADALSARLADVRRDPTADRFEALERFVTEAKSKLGRLLKQRIDNPYLAHRIGVAQRRPAGGPRRFGLLLPAEDIGIEG